MRLAQFLTFRVQHEAGFRLNLLDLALIALLCTASWLLYPIWREGWLFLLPLYVGYSFFLFCNVFRIGNRLERYWYPPFVVAVVALHTRPELLWWVLLLVLEPLKAGLIVHRIRRGDYHGAGYRRLRPDLA